MAVSSFKSSSRRGNNNNNQSSSSSTNTPTRSSTTKNPPIRRSRSVSAFSRTTTTFDTEFLNKRDNPLFDQISKSNQTVPFLETSAPSSTSRGRSVARNVEPGRNKPGRSVSRVDTGRRSTRSASQCPVSRRSFNYSTSESEADCKDRNGLKLGGTNRKGCLFGRTDKDVMDQEKDLRRWSSQHSAVEVSDCFASTSSGLQTQICDDVDSTASSGFGCDEKTIKAVCEQKSVQRDQPGAGDIYETVRSEVRRAISEIQIDLESAIQKSNATDISVTDMTDIHPDLLNPGTVELAFESKLTLTAVTGNPIDAIASIIENLPAGSLRSYEVFLSFRGDDTRSSFTSHLYASLQNDGINVFKDDDSLQRGDHISKSLLLAIEESQISVIIFSKNYADSRWCLDELVKIMKCRRTIGQIVLPVFYDVDPSDVRHQTGEFGKAFQSLLSRISKKKSTSLKWRDALREAAELAGFVVPNFRNESEAIKNIVDKVARFIDKTDLFVADNPVGLESRVQDMIQLLDIQQSNDVLLIGMWGMGGIGKTTLAKDIFNKIGRNFEGRSFIPNIREVWGQPAGQVDLQQQLLSDIFKGTSTKIQSIDSGKVILKDRLCHKRVFIILDDVDELEQLDALCGSRNWFGSGSRIIITTRNKDILRGNRVDKVYSNKEMDENESIELFNWHAFKQVSPIEEFVEISKNVVMYSGGLPLALEVLGRHLFEKKVTEWNCVLKKLERIPNDKVQKKLKISYDGLDDDYQKSIFLDVACFFIGMDRNDVIHILNGCGFFAEDGISVLVERSLVTVDNKNKLGMHNLLRDMGREIICNKPRMEPEERSRLWFLEDVDDVLVGQTGTKAVEGLTLKLPRDSAKCYSTKAFENMKKLRLLQLAGVQLDGDFEYLSRNLRWLSWNGFPLSCIPSSFYQGNLVSIELENSNVKVVWKVTQRMEKLKILNLSHSHYLTETPDFSNMPNLEKLILIDCPRLREVSHSIGHLDKILLINLEDCISLQSLPRSIYKLKSLKTLILSGCSMIDKLEEDLEQMESLTTLLANNTAITRVPLSIVRSKSIGYISLCGHEGFSRDIFPSIIWSWMSPTSSLSSPFQTSSANISCLVSLDIPHSSSQELSSISDHLSRLRSLWVECGSELQLSVDAKIILDSLYATISKEMDSTSATSKVSNMNTSALIQHCSQLRASESKYLLKSVLLQLGMNSEVTNNLKESILQNMDENGCGGCLFPSDSCPDWLTFNCEGSSVMFEVPQVEGRTLKTMMICIDFSSTLDNITSNGLANLLVKNYTKATIQLYKREALASFEDEEGQRVVSSIEPCNKVEVVAVFENGFIVKKTTVYLVYDGPIGEKMEQCQEQEEIVCSGDEDECFVREVSYNAQDYNVIVSSSGDENECVVRNVSPQVALAPMEDLQHNRRKKIFKWRWKTVKQWFCKS